MRPVGSRYLNVVSYFSVILLSVGQTAHAQTMEHKRAAQLSVKLKDQTNLWQGQKLLSLWRGNPARKEIALTFDDGPHPPFTQRLLALLKQLNVKATFFLVGKKVDKAPDVVSLIVREGHEVANHTYHHMNLDKMTQAEAATEIRLGNEAIRRACGKTPVVFRPPGGHHLTHVLRAAGDMHMTVILWTDDPADFANPGADVIVARVLDQVGSGSDILLHDGVEQTLEMLPDLVARLRQAGYRFVTVSEMVRHVEEIPWAKTGAAAPRISTNRPTLPKVPAKIL
jgi:peptidoglycan/xylan/chitin deacetylase (PgdA/CDA1 family)